MLSSLSLTRRIMLRSESSPIAARYIVDGELDFLAILSDKRARAFIERTRAERQAREKLKFLGKSGYFNFLLMKNNSLKVFIFRITMC